MVDDPAVVAAEVLASLSPATPAAAATPTPDVLSAEDERGLYCLRHVTATVPTHKLGLAGDLEKYVASLRAALAALRAENATLKADGERLDWLEDAIVGAAGKRFCITNGETVIYMDVYGSHELRAVIDAAANDDGDLGGSSEVRHSVRGTPRQPTDPSSSPAAMQQTLRATEDAR